jgi:hypothetical protein
MSVMPTRRRVSMLLRNDRRRTSNLSSLRRRTEAESFSSEVIGYSGVEWRTLGSVFGSNAPAARPQELPPQVNSSYRRTPVSQSKAAPLSTVAEVLTQIDSSSLNRRDGD